MAKMLWNKEWWAISVSWIFLLQVLISSPFSILCILSLLHYTWARVSHFLLCYLCCSCKQFTLLIIDTWLYEFTNNRQQFLDVLKHNQCLAQSGFALQSLQNSPLKISDNLPQGPQSLVEQNNKQVNISTTISECAEPQCLAYISFCILSCLSKACRA